MEEAGLYSVVCARAEYVADGAGFEHRYGWGEHPRSGEGQTDPQGAWWKISWWAYFMYWLYGRLLYKPNWNCCNGKNETGESAVIHECYPAKERTLVKKFKCGKTITY